MTVSLSPAQLADFSSATGRLSTRGVGAFLILVTRIQGHGPVPFDDRLLAGIVWCGVKTWTTRIWPEIAHLFDVEDGLVSYGVTQIGPSKASMAASKAARAMHAQREERKRAQLSLIADNPQPEKAAPAPADSMRFPANAENNAAISTPPAENAQEVFAADAAAPQAGGVSGGGSAQPARTRAHPLSPSPDSGFEGDSEGERGGSGGNAAAAATTPTQPAQKLDAPRTQRPRRSDAPAPALRFPPEWQPNAAGAAEAQRHGYEPANIADQFRLHYIARGEVRADWDAEFIRWVRRQASFDGAPRQGYIMTTGGGAKPPDTPTPAPTEADKALAARLAPLRKETALGMRDAPSPNLFREFCARDDAALVEAHRWLACAEAWVRAGKPGGSLRPTWLDMTSPNSRAIAVQRLAELEADLSESAPAERRAADG
jgi:uncharacterized protein YdaU (DUF1376 family)